MNKINRIVYNKELGRLVVASELTSSDCVGAVHGGDRSPGLTLRPLVVMLSMLLGFAVMPFAPANTLPSDRICVTATSAIVGRTNPGTTSSGPVDGTGTYSVVAGCQASGNNQSAASVYGGFSQVFGRGGSAFGFLSRAGQWGSAFGLEAQANGIAATALGFGSNAIAPNSVAIGGAGGDGTTPLPVANSTTASGAGSIAIGSNATRGAQATAADSIALGGQSSVTTAGTSGIAVGRGATVGGARGLAAGDGATVSSADATAIGTNAGIGATSAKSVAIGPAAAVAANAGSSVAIGDAAKANTGNTVAIGRSSTASGSSDVALGNATLASGGQSVAAGDNSRATGVASVAMGSSARASGPNGIAIGVNTVASGPSSLAMGVGTAAVGSNSIALGSAFTGLGSTGSEGIAIGMNAGRNVSNTNNIAVGGFTGNTVSGIRNVAIGTNTGNNVTARSTVAIGDSAQVGGDSAIAIGSGAQANGAQSISIGTGNVVSGVNSGAIGDPTTVTGSGTYTLGNNNGTVGANESGIFGNNNTLPAGSNNSRIVGNGNTVNSANVMVMGNGVTVGTGLSGAVVLGNGATVSAAVDTPSAIINGNTYSFAGGSPADGDVVSVGSGTVRRQIQNVAAGRLSVTSTDAVNGSQLHATNQAVGTLGTQVTNLGSSMAIALGGGASYSPTGTVSAPSYNITNTGGTTNAYNDVGNALTVLNQTASAGWNVSAEGANATNVAPSETVDLNNSDGNIVVSKTATSDNVTFDLANDITVDSVTAGNSVLDTRGLTVDDGTSSTSYGSTGMTIVGGPSVTASGIDAGSQTITNVAPGVNGTDAANVNQVNTAVSNVTTAGLDFTGNDATAGDVHRDLGQTLAIQGDATTAGTYNGANLKTVTDPITGAINLQIADAPKFGAVTINDGGTGKITGVTAGSAGTDAVNVDQLNAVATTAGNADQTAVKYDWTDTNGNGVVDAGEVNYNNVTLAGTGGTTITNLADGAVNATSTDAVNGSQLYGVSQSVANNLGGGSVVNADGTVTGPTYVVQGDSYTTVYDAVTAVDGRLTTINSTLSNINKGGGIKYFHANSTGADSVAVGANSVAVGPNAVSNGASSVAIGDGAVAGHDNSVALGAGSATTMGAQSGYSAAYVGSSSSTGEVNVGGRTVSGVAAGVAATDAVNVSQLNAGVNHAINTANAYTDTKVAEINTTVNNVAGDVTDIKNGAAGMFQVGQDDTTAPAPTGTSSVAGGAGAVATGANSTAIGNHSTASGTGSTALGNGASASGNNSVAIGAGSVASADNTVSVGSAGNERTVSNVAAGVADTDAVNVSQLKSTSAGTVQYDRNANGTVNYNSVTLNSGGTGTTAIHNVSAGTASTDAVNIGQLQAGLGNTLNQANLYTDSRIGQLQDDMWSMDRGYRGATAAAMAMAGMPQAYLPGKSMLSVGMGGYQGEVGMAVGLSGITENGRYVYKAQASGNTTRDWGFSVGAGIQW